MENVFVRQSWMEIVTTATRDNTRPSEIFKGMQQPDFQVTPNMVQVDFYGAGANELEYNPEKSFSPRKQAHKGSDTSTDEFFTSESVRTVAIIGGAGYGKTEMLKKFSNAVLDKKVCGLEEIKIVHHMNFLNLETSEKVCPGKLLFGNTDMSEEDINESVQWIRDNSEQFLLVIDGADQYQDFQNLGKRFRVGNHSREGNPTEILNGILSGKLFRGIRILYSSREHGIRGFSTEVRPHTVIELVGLSYDSVEKLVKGLGGEHGTVVWDHLQKKAPALLSACSIPMFLVFTVLVFLENMENPPETFTEVLMLVLRDMIVSEHVRTREGIYNIIHSLKEMCFKGTKESRVTFTLNDLPADLPVENLMDLIIPHPGPHSGSSKTNQNLVEGNYKYILCHQSLQEALASLWLFQMSFKEFKDFLKYLHTPHWAIVRRIAFGIFLNERTRKIVEGGGTVSLLRPGRIVISGAKGVSQQQPTIHNHYNAQVHNETTIAAQTYACGQATIKDKNTNCKSTVLVGKPTKEAMKSAMKDEAPQPQEYDNSITKKKDALKQSLLDQFRKPQLEQHDLLELLHSLHECGPNVDEIITSSIEEINFSDTRLTKADFYVVGSTVSQCNNLKLLKLQYVNDKAWERLGGFLKKSNSKVQIKKVHWAMFGGDIRVIASILSRVSDIDYLELVDLTESELKTLTQAMKESNVRIKNLEMDYMFETVRVGYQLVNQTHGEVLAICEMLPYVTDEMTIYCDDHQFSAVYQEKLESIPPTNVTVRLESRLPSITLNQIHQPHHELSSTPNVGNE